MVGNSDARVEVLDYNRGRLTIKPDITLEHSLSVLDNVFTGNFPKVVGVINLTSEVVRRKYSPYTGGGKLPQNLAYALATEHPVHFTHQDFNNGFTPHDRTELSAFEAEARKNGRLQREITKKEERKLFMSLNYNKRILHERAEEIFGMTGSNGKYECPIRGLVSAYGNVSLFLETITLLNLGLVWTIAKGLRNLLEYEELIDIGLSKLSHAVDRFDFNRGTKFSSYFCKVITKESLKEKAKIDRERETAWNYFVNLRGKGFKGEEDFSADIVRTLFEGNCAGLNSRERGIIYGRFFLGETLKTVGSWFGITRERARQIEERSKEKIESAFNRKYAERYNEEFRKKS
jgi:RNA polymerase sigma factor (sigma-70 family)